MTRPTQTPPPGAQDLRDADVPDWLERHDPAALLFWDRTDERSRVQRARAEIAAAGAGIPLGVLDVRTDPLVAHALGVPSVPTLVVFRGGEVAERLIGGAPDAVLRDALRGPERPHRAG